MADDYWSWYNSAFGAPAPQGPQPGPPQMTPQQITDFYQSVGITSPVGQPPTTRPVQSVPVNMPPLPRPAPERATTIASYSTKPQTTGNSYAGQETYKAPRPPGTMLPSVPGPNGYTSFAKTEERLLPSAPGLTAPLTPQMLAALGVGPLSTQYAAAGNKIAPMPFPRPPSFPVTQMAQGKVAPTPFNRPTAVGTQLATQPMPPMPIPRPGIGGPIGPAPMPGPFGIKLPQLPSLPNAQQVQQAMQSMFQPKVNAGSGGYNPNTGTFGLNFDTIHNGFSGSDSSGGAHGGSDKDKHRGEAVTYNGRNMK